MRVRACVCVYVCVCTCVGVYLSILGVGVRGFGWMGGWGEVGVAGWGYGGLIILLSFASM